MEDRCPGCLGASNEISQPLDSETLPWLAIPATQPWAPTSSHPGTCHTELNSGKREGGGGREEENREDNSKLSYKLLWYATLKHATTLAGTEPALPTANCWPLDKYQLLFVINLVKLHSTAYKLVCFNNSIYWEKMQYKMQYLIVVFKPLGGRIHWT